MAGSDLILADGQAVVWASRLLREPLPERVAGIDLFMELLAEAEHSGDRVYFLGARPDVLAKVVAEAERVGASPAVTAGPAASEPIAPLFEVTEEDPALYIGRVLRAKEYIRAGDLYQANLSRPWPDRT